MVEPGPLHATGRALLSPEVVARLQDQLPHVAELGLSAITDEIPEYAGTWRGEMAGTIAAAITFAMGAFLRLLDRAPEEAGAEPPLADARQGAYDLGRGEAKAGRTADALLAAYRIGARVSWQEMSAVAVAEGVDAGTIAEFAALVFAYIDELSAASVAGHTDQLARSGRLRQQRREQLAKALLSGAPAARLDELAIGADWTTPDTLTAVLLPSSQVRDALPHLGADTLNVPTDALELARTDAASSEPLNVLLVPDVVKTRAHLLRVLEGRGAVVGPPRPWTEARASLDLALRARALIGPPAEAVLDTHAHLEALVVGADLGALRDLRQTALAPLAELTPAAGERLTETLRAWLSHLGRRGDVAEALHVHPQTVRYRMTQIRELYGDALDDPAVVQRLVIALALEQPGQTSDA